MTDQRMTAIEIAEPGGPEVLTPSTFPIPQPGPDEILIRVAAAGINRPDVAQRQGVYPPPKGASPLPGLEVAGTIAALGDGVEGWSEGEEVCALVSGGGYAEYCVAPAAQCLPKPAGLSMVEAAALPETTFTVWANLVESGGLKAGEWALVHGGSSGIGTTAIQMARALDAHVIVTAGTDEKCKACLALGADHAVNYRTEDFVDAALKATGGAGVNLVLDMVGGDYVPRNLKTLAAHGRHVSIAVLGGTRATIDIRDIMMRQLMLTGSLLRPRSVEEKGRIAAALREHVWPWVEAGKLRPLIHARFPLRQAAEAHALMESSAHIGKIVLET